MYIFSRWYVKCNVPFKYFNFFKKMDGDFDKEELMYCWKTWNCTIEQELLTLKIKCQRQDAYAIMSLLRLAEDLFLFSYLIKIANCSLFSTPFKRKLSTIVTLSICIGLLIGINVQYFRYDTARGHP